jgi:hypothetical protein
MRIVVVPCWASFILGPDDSIDQEDSSTGSRESTFLYVLKDNTVCQSREHEMTKFVC